MYKPSSQNHHRDLRHEVLAGKMIVKLHHIHKSMKKKPQSAQLPCYCESSKPYAACCKPLHEDELTTTAEQLMRSRYSAYVLGLEAYLLRTWHADTRPASLDLTNDAKTTRWIGLKVKCHEVLDSSTAIVEFIASYKLNGKAHKLHEISRFIKQNEQWLYIDGEIAD
ncbi:YchJ family protein [Methylovorus sp. MM2]|uniref:YchJ family protein n=1 Tax=Methylovorus sp. MM2 TaxID=1848038 RepID=UPI0020B7F98C|nr:YchJ family metal-binding protein [Methylovorus sp. MM2]